MPDGSSIAFTENLEKDLAAVEGCDAKIASGGGRMYVTMDRYEVPFHCFCHRLNHWGRGPHPFASCSEQMQMYAGDTVKTLLSQCCLTMTSWLGRNHKAVSVLASGILLCI